MRRPGLQVPGLNDKHRKNGARASDHVVELYKRMCSSKVYTVVEDALCAKPHEGCRNSSSIALIASCGQVRHFKTPAETVRCMSAYTQATTETNTACSCASSVQNAANSPRLGLQRNALQRLSDAVALRETHLVPVPECIVPGACFHLLSTPNRAN